MASDFDGFSKATLKFLRGVAKNNDKAWFAEHRAEYDDCVVEPAKLFVSALGDRFSTVAKGVNAEPRVNGSIFRIHRDTRFSKDKTPYKTTLDMWFWQGKGRSRELPGFFFRLTPRALILGAGIHGFDPKTLEKYRKAVADAKKGKALTTAIAEIEKAGDYSVGGQHYKKVPRGYPADHPRAELLRHSALYATWDAKVPPELYTAEFPDFCIRHFKNVAPIQAWVSKLFS